MQSLYKPIDDGLYLITIHEGLRLGEVSQRYRDHNYI